MTHNIHPSHVTPGTWNTVFAGNLAYSVTEESLKYTIDDAMGGEGNGKVAQVRVARDRDTGRKRGFGYVDFLDEAAAREACEKLSGMQVMGRAIKMEFEGPKKRAIPAESGGSEPGGGEGRSWNDFRDRVNAKYKNVRDRGDRKRMSDRKNAGQGGW